MVDAFVSYAVQKLGDFLIQEVSLRRSLRQDVMWLRKELLFMQSFLKDAEQKQVEDHTVRRWVFEINEIANDSVAILETYSLEAGEGDGDGLANRLKAAEGDGDGLASRLKACACICRKETKFYNVSKEIQSLKQRIKDISCKRETYGIRDTNNVGEGPNNYRPNSQRSGLRRTTSYMDKQDQIFVGFKDVVERLLAELVKAQPRRTVISIYGMGGLGKTTLAKHLYHSPSLTGIFDARAWVCVSQQYNTIDLLKDIIKSIQGRDRETLDLLEKMTITDLEKHLQDLLKEKKYLVVVDDVWQREAWQSLERAIIEAELLLPPAMRMWPKEQMTTVFPIRDLQLVDTYEGKEITCSDNNFSQLEFLHLVDLGKLERWDLATSAMPLIKGLRIYNCHYLREIPERMKDVEKLEPSDF